MENLMHDNRKEKEDKILLYLYGWKTHIYLSCRNESILGNRAENKCFHEGGHMLGSRNLKEFQHCVHIRKREYSSER